MLWSTHPFGPLSHGHPCPSRVVYKVSKALGIDTINVHTVMSGSKHMLPPPVYLPSSGGYTSSRLASEVSLCFPPAPLFEMAHGLSVQPFHQHVFTFRRYSVEEDGRLVVRTRNAGYDSYVPSILTARTV